ncbi:hypothetical protein P7C70_g5375, partial [Phenoliferia sp. Uapishka_3]
MSSDLIICCPSASLYKPTRTEHESKFADFIRFARTAVASPVPETTTELSIPEYIIQVVKQVNFGSVVFKKYFARDATGDWVQVTERDVVRFNFAKVNSYKNLKCSKHNLFYEVNLYQLNPHNKHHWRADVARPASEIDL